MQRWVRRWTITIRWDRAENSPFGTAVVQRIVDTPGELRRLVLAARADPHVIALPYRSVRQLDGPEPTTCHQGHPYAGGSFTRPVRDWLICNGCGGHHVIKCRWPGCTDTLISPPLCAGCDARPPRDAGGSTSQSG